MNPFWMIWPIICPLIGFYSIRAYCKWDNKKQEEAYKIKCDNFTGPSIKEEPFIRPCHFCGCQVRMQKDQTEGKPVACFDHSYKFMENL